MTDSQPSIAGQGEPRETTSVVLAVDNDYLPHVPCMLAQLAEHAPGHPVVLVVSAGSSPSELERVRSTADRLDVAMRVREVADIDVMASQGRIASRDYVSTFTYVKLLLPDLLPDVDQVLYLDVDILLRASLRPLLDWPLHYPIGGVPELGLNGLQIHGTVRTPYFNAGVLRMSLDGLRKDRLWEQALRVLKQAPRLRYQDQDVFNSLFHDRFDALPLTFNVFNSVSVENPKLKVFADPVVVHFTGPAKPWLSHVLTPFARDWRRVNAEVLGLSEEAASDYIRGTVRTKQSEEKRLVEAARFSPLGVALRTHVPLVIKVPISRAMYSLVPEGPAVSGPDASNRGRIVRAIRYSPPGRSLRASLPVPVKRPVSVALRALTPRTYFKNAYTTKQSRRYRLLHPVFVMVTNAWPSTRGSAEPVRGAVGMAPQPAASTAVHVPHPPARATRRMPVATRETLHILASQARSGTNAVASMVHQGFEDVAWFGEIYAGFLKDQHTPDLRAEFPWIDDLEQERMGNRSPEESPEWAAKRRAYRQTVSAEVVPLTRYLLESTDRMPAIKVFDDHLEPAAVRELMQTFRPTLLVMRRTYIYSLISWLKARNTGIWSIAENTQAAAPFNGDLVRRFIDRGEAWHSHLSALARELDLPVTHITYEGLFERRTDIKLLRDFFRGATLTDKGSTDEMWLPRTVIQDRRSDESLTPILESFALLPKDLRQRLLHLPGEGAWGDVNALG